MVEYPGLVICVHIRQGKIKLLALTGIEPLLSRWEGGRDTLVY